MTKKDVKIKWNKISEVGVPENTDLYLWCTADDDIFLSSFSIHDGFIIDDSGKQYFPLSNKFITHWFGPIDLP